MYQPELKAIVLPRGIIWGGGCKVCIRINFDLNRLFWPAKTSIVVTINGNIRLMSLRDSNPWYCFDELLKLFFCITRCTLKFNPLPPKKNNFLWLLSWKSSAETKTNKNIKTFLLRIRQKLCHTDIGDIVSYKLHKISTVF